MAAVITPSLRSALERLKHAGSVNGLLLGWRRQILINLLPYEDFRAERALQTLIDSRGHFNSGGDRDVSTMWFAFEGVFALALFQGEVTLLVLHAQAAEVDFLKSAATTFLDDTQLLIDAVIHPSEEASSEPETQLLV
jgi:hypothetical protein